MIKVYDSENDIIHWLNVDHIVSVTAKNWDGTKDKHVFQYGARTEITLTAEPFKIVNRTDPREIMEEIERARRLRKKGEKQ